MLWLGPNNILYKDIIINYEEIANCEDEFVPRYVKDNIVLSLSDYFKHKSYTHNFSQNNLKNNMYTAISNYKKLQSDFLNRCVFSDIDGMLF